MESLGYIIVLLGLNNFLVTACENVNKYNIPLIAGFFLADHSAGCDCTWNPNCEFSFPSEKAEKQRYIHY